MWAGGARWLEERKKENVALNECGLWYKQKSWTFERERE